MTTQPINILVTFDENYIEPFKTMFYSAVKNNVDRQFVVWLLYSNMSEEALDSLNNYCRSLGAVFKPLQVEDYHFKDAHVTDRYPREMYFRLLAPFILPDEIGRVLYLDPDILVINDLAPLWQKDLGDYCFAAASHKGFTDMVGGINRVRLQTEHDYFNTGVILMDLDRARRVVDPEEIFTAVNKMQSVLILPDQDIFNHLYSKYTLLIKEEIWNYDTRKYTRYYLRSEQKYTPTWTANNTAILHFCGRDKPWESTKYTGFVLIYQHYNQMRKKFEKGLINS